MSVKWRVAKCHESEPPAGTILPDWRSQWDDRNTRRHLCVGLLAGPIAAQTKVTKYQWVEVTDRQHIGTRQDAIV